MLSHHIFIQPADINECELETYPCHFNANCTDTEGSFNCTCNEGFEGNGFSCAGTICIITFIIMYICTYTCAYIHLSLICNSQIFQSVKERLTIVTPMQLAQIRLEVMSVIATLDLLEMELCVQVSDHAVVRYLKCTHH